MVDITLTASTMLARLAAGNAKAASIAEILTLLNVEAGATADQTGAEIKTAYEAEANAYTDAKDTKLAGIATSADVVIGKHTIWIPAAAMTPSVTAGCGSLNRAETTAGRPDIKYLPFDASTEEHAQFNVAFPKSWGLGTVTYQAFWSRIAAPTGGADDVHWGLQGVSITDDVTLDSAYGTEVEVDVDEAQATEDLWVSAESGAVTIALTPIDDDLCEFQISRVVGSETGGLDVDACLVGIKLFYTIDTGTDA